MNSLMAEFLWGVICEDIILDADTGQISYLKVLENIQPEELPIELPRIYLGAIWRREEQGEEIRVRMRVLNPDGDEIATTEEGTFRFDEEKWWRTRFTLGNLPVKQSGTLRFRIEQFVDGEWRTEAYIPFDVYEPPQGEEDAEENAEED